MPRVPPAPPAAPPEVGPEVADPDWVRYQLRQVHALCILGPQWLKDEGFCDFPVSDACGDGVLDIGEECDDGNALRDDGCSPNCLIELPPVVDCSVKSPVLRPANHKLVDVGFNASAKDDFCGPLPLDIQVFGNEDDEEPTGDGVFSPDAVGFARGSLRLRAERRGNGRGRVYLIVASATDGSGDTASDCCTVSVPRSKRKADVGFVNAQANMARQYCRANNGAAPPGYVVVGDGPSRGGRRRR